MDIGHRPMDRQILAIKDSRRNVIPLFYDTTILIINALSSSKRRSISTCSLSFITLLTTLPLTAPPPQPVFFSTLAKNTNFTFHPMPPVLFTKNLSHPAQPTACVCPVLFCVPTTLQLPVSSFQLLRLCFPACRVQLQVAPGIGDVGRVRWEERGGGRGHTIGAQCWEGAWKERLGTDTHRATYSCGLTSF